MSAQCNGQLSTHPHLLPWGVAPTCAQKGVPCQLVFFTHPPPAPTCTHAVGVPAGACLRASCLWRGRGSRPAHQPSTHQVCKKVFAPIPSSHLRRRRGEGGLSPTRRRESFPPNSRQRSSPSDMWMAGVEEGAKPARFRAFLHEKNSPLPSDGAGDGMPGPYGNTHFVGAGGGKGEWVDDSPTYKVMGPPP